MGVAAVLISQDSGPKVLAFDDAAGALVAILLAFVAIGVVLLAIRRRYWVKRPGNEAQGQPGAAGEGDSYVRSLLALWLVAGLVAMTVLSFAIDDTTLRSTLVGGLTASAGGAVAYYFSTKAAADARKDFLEAAGAGPQTVPDLTGQTVGQAKQAFSENEGLRLRVDPAAAADSDAITRQEPAAKTRVARGSTVTVFTR